MNSKRHLLLVPKLFLLLLIVVSLSGCEIKIKNLFSDRSTNSTTTNSAEAAYLNGINIMDLGISGHVLPGVFNTNYTKPSLSSLQYLKSRGNKVIRIPFLWERVQPTLGGALDSAYMGYIIDVLKDAHTAGLKVILDMHNYGRYNGEVMGSVLGPTEVQYKDAWTKIVNAIAAEPLASPAVYAYDIMNEPHDLPDTRGTLDNATMSPIATFAANLENWEALWTDPNVAVSRDARNGGSLKIDYTTGAGAYLISGVARYVIPSLGSAAGGSIRIRGNLPANTQGDYPRIRVSIFSTGWQAQSIGMVVVNKGEDFDLVMTPTAGQWATAMGMTVELILNSVDGNGPYTFYIDDISQGTPIVGKAPSVIWEEYSQAAVDAIRATGDTNKIMIEGNDYSSAKNWATNHPVKWIVDPLDKIIYQAHLYLDTEFSGLYAHTFADEVTNAISEGHANVSDRSIANAKLFTDWLTAQGVSGYIGEIGWPNSATNADSAQWDIVGDNVLTFLDSKNVGYTLWATGSWLGPTTNILNVYDISNTTPLSQAAVLESHL